MVQHGTTIIQTCLKNIDFSLLSFFWWWVALVFICLSIHLWLLYIVLYYYIRLSLSLYYHIIEQCKSIQIRRSSWGSSAARSIVFSVKNLRGNRDRIKRCKKKTAGSTSSTPPFTGLKTGFYHFLPIQMARKNHCGIPHFSKLLPVSPSCGFHVSPGFASLRVRRPVFEKFQYLAGKCRKWCNQESWVSGLGPSFGFFGFSICWDATRCNHHWETVRMYIMYR